ncbi:hypothetical protein F4821DRAFT_19327 [Hypoxylon rubiginosum]|uniref:Uncharacterized protein n=1 Tax=Hypoxylon rubiginosum TaxID=110542 RepID=A0ACC0DDL1_9PEZI|nr:hypothetical protein F4821DRAFT_19327 [Hypoxylon rubiginosum]
MDSPDSNKDTVLVHTSPQLNSTNETEVEPSSKTNFDQSIVDMSTPVPLEEESTASEPETKECEVKETETKETETKETEAKESEVKESEVKESEVSEPEVNEPRVNEPEVKVEQQGIEEMGNSLSQRAMDTSAPDSPVPMDNQDQAAAQPTTSDNFAQTTEIDEAAPDSVDSETDTSTDATSSTSSSSTSSSSTSSSSTSTLIADEESNQVGFRSSATSRATSSTFTYEINPQYFVLPTSPHNAFFYLHYLTHVPQVYLFTAGSPFLAIAPFVIPPPVMSDRVAAAPARAVNFARTNTIIQPDGRAEMQPTNASATRPDADEVIELAEAAAAGEIPEPAPEAIPSVDPIPPSGPPPNPPAPPAAAAAAAPEPNNNNNGLPPALNAAPPAAPPPAAAAAPANPGVGAPGQNIYPRVVSQVAPPFGRRAQAAASNPGAPIIIMNPAPAQPQQNMTFVNANQQQPFLWVNAPMVAPSVPAPQPGNTGSWCKFFSSHLSLISILHATCLDTVVYMYFFFLFETPAS